MAIETLAWVLPRPRRPHYPGGFPLWFEKRLLDLYDWPEKILHVFGGKAEYGLRLDVNSDVEPDIVGDAHKLPFRDNVFDIVIGDPPYSNGLSKKVYNTGKIVYRQWVGEAVRVCKPGGYVVVYHARMLPRPRGTAYHRRIFLGVRIWHYVRCVTIFRKEDV